MTAVVLSISTMIIAMSFIDGFQNEIRNKVFTFWGHVHIVPYSLSKTHHDVGIPASTSFSNSKNLPYVKDIQKVVTKPCLMKSKSGFDGAILKGIGEDYRFKNINSFIIAGDMLSNDSTRAKQILISKSMAQRLNLTTGDKVIVHFPDKEIKTRALRVKGIYETGVEEFDKEIAFADIGFLQELNGWENDTISSFELFLEPQQLFKSKWKTYLILFGGAMMPEELYHSLSIDPLDEMTYEINQQIEESSMEAIGVKDIYPGLFDWLSLQNMNELIIIILMILVAAINMISALLIFVLERTRMIGLLKSVGAKDTSLMAIFMYYGIFVVLVGILLGNIFGVSLCLLQQHFHFIKLPMDSYYLSYAPISLSFWNVLFINIGTIVLCFLALLLPLNIIRKINPVKTIQFD